MIIWYDLYNVIWYKCNVLNIRFCTEYGLMSDDSNQQRHWCQVWVRCLALTIQLSTCCVVSSASGVAKIYTAWWLKPTPWCWNCWGNSWDMSFYNSCLAGSWEMLSNQATSVWRFQIWIQKSVFRGSVWQQEVFNQKKVFNRYQTCSTSLHCFEMFWVHITFVRLD